MIHLYIGVPKVLEYDMLTVIDTVIFRGLSKGTGD